MADDGNEDSWLYGSSNPEPPENGETEDDDKNANGNIEPEKKSDEHDKTEDKAENEEDGLATEAPDEMEEQDENIDEQENKEEHNENGDMDSDESDDDINVVIGDIKSGPSYNIKQRGTLLQTSIPTVLEKPKQPTGKFNIEEFETVGTINGVPAHEFSIDSLDEKPWRKPGADITDYFNYGFNEDTWRGYCEKQKKMRLNESGVGLLGLAVGLNNANSTTVSNNRTLTTLANDNSKYAGAASALRRAGPPPGRKMTGSIDVIGGNGISSRREDGTLITKPNPLPVKENVIQVMTADRREYSRTGNKFDTSMPPPFNAEIDPFYNEHESYNYGYEPTQDWAVNIPINTGWAPSGIKELTPGPQMVPPPVNMQLPQMQGPMQQMRPMGHMGPGGHNQMNGPHNFMGPPNRFMPPMHGDRQMSDRDRERDHGRDRDRDRERDRERETRERDRDRGDREIKIEEPERNNREEESPSRDRDRKSSRPDRYRDRRRERSRSRERSRRRSRSRDRDHRNRDKKKSHKKDKEESE